MNICLNAVMLFFLNRDKGTNFSPKIGTICPVFFVYLTFFVPIDEMHYIRMALERQNRYSIWLSKSTATPEYKTP